MTRSNHAIPRAEKPRNFHVFGQEIAVERPPGGLYLVATPLGNMGDVTLRALETLAGVDAVACEDSRITRRLFERYGIATPLIPYHDHNAETARPKILVRLDAGEAIALVSDAGTPLISDPGFKLVRADCFAESNRVIRSVTSSQSIGRHTRRRRKRDVRRRGNGSNKGNQGLVADAAPCASIDNLHQFIDIG